MKLTNIILIFLPFLFFGCAEEKSASGPKTKMAAFGDSVTQGLNESTGYITFLENANNLKVTNYAKGGTKIYEQKNVIINTDISTYEGVIFLSGYNDMRFYGVSEEALKQYEIHLKEILDYFFVNNKVVYLGNCMRMLADGYTMWAPYDKGSDRAAIMYAEVLNKLAVNYPNVIVVDINSIIWARAEISGDKVHPDILGMLKIAQEFYFKM